LRFAQSRVVGIGFRSVGGAGAPLSSAPRNEAEPAVVKPAERPSPVGVSNLAMTLRQNNPRLGGQGSEPISVVADEPLSNEARPHGDAIVAEGQTGATAANVIRSATQGLVSSQDPEVLLKTVDAILPHASEKEAVRTQIQAAKEKLPQTSFKKVELAQSLVAWTGDNTPVAQAVIAAKPDLTSMRDVALHFNVEKLAQVIDTRAVPETTPGATIQEKQRNFAVALRQKLFSAEPTAVLHRMVEDAELPIADHAVRSGITKFLGNQPNFNIRTTSVYAALEHPDPFKDIPEADRGAVVDHLKILQRVQAISPVPEAVPALMTANLTSAFHVAEKPEPTFLRAFGPSLGEDTARQIYTNAVNAHIRNEHALTTLHQTMRGTGLAIIDGKPQTLEARVAGLQQLADQKNVPLNLSTLFGSLDHCDCDECLSVYSPAAYFVELLQFLRNNDLDPKNPSTGKKGIAGTPLEKLFRRRPDLGCLELTCENTFTVLPYIDLVNEVMESFVVHLGQYHKDTHDPRQATLEAFNVDGETSGELLAIPQHVNYDAYCILRTAVYPFTLP
jgi:Salmonella virulence plasmid 28.1kDa A protein